jgi:hypothetical protein
MLGGLFERTDIEFFLNLLLEVEEQLINSP